MKKLEAGSKTFYQFDHFPSDELLHFTSTRSGWGGSTPCRFTGDIPQVYAGYRQELADSLNLEEKQLVLTHFLNSDELLTPSENNGKAYLDLWQANRSLLTGQGVPPEQIAIMGFCSYQEADKFYSARREGIQTGRMVSGIMLKLRDER